MTAGLLEIVSAAQPVKPRELLSKMVDAGHAPDSARLLVQIGFERGDIKLDRFMRVYTRKRLHQPQP